MVNNSRAGCQGWSGRRPPTVGGSSCRAPPVLCQTPSVRLSSSWTRSFPPSPSIRSHRSGPLWSVLTIIWISDWFVCTASSHAASHQTPCILGVSSACLVSAVQFWLCYEALKKEKKIAGVLRQESRGGLLRAGPSPLRYYLRKKSLCCRLCVCTRTPAQFTLHGSRHWFLPLRNSSKADITLDFFSSFPW